MSRLSFSPDIINFPLVKLDWIKIIIAIFAVTALMAVETDSLRNFIGKYFPFQAALVENITSKSGEEAIFESEPEKITLEEETNEEGETNPVDYEEEESEGAEVNLPLIGTSTDSLTEIQNKIDDISEKIDTLKQEFTDLMGEQKIAQEKIKESDDEEEINKEDSEEPKIEEEEVGQEVGQVICERIIGAQPSKNKVIINEVAWIGGTVSANDEWIELKNISGTPVNLTGWQLMDKGKQIKIIFGSGEQFSANSFYLLERSNDESVPNILADLIYTGALSDSDEALYLFNEACQLEDEVEAFPNWPAGDKLEKRSMERKADFSWQTSLNSGGTPKAENSSGYSVPPVGGGGTPVPEPMFCSQENLSQPSHLPIIFNEIAWMGTLNDWRDEWIELKNISENEISINGWQILNKNEEIKVNLSGKIPANELYLLERTNDESVPNIPADKIYTGNLKDSDESLRLFDQNCSLIDEISANPDWPAGNKIERRSMERTKDFSWQTYFGEGKEGIMGTPKEENSQPEELKDETPPSVYFNDISPLQISPTFTVSWSGEDPSDTATPSGIDGFLLRYSQNKEDWNYFPSESEYTQETQYIFTGENNQNYYFQIKAKDKAGNESEWVEISTEINILPIVINEIAWMGTETAYQDEWIELYNNTNLSLSLDGWTLKAGDGTPEINLTGIILPQSFYLLERTNDETVPDIPADQIYTGSLGNEGEDLAIYDKSANLIDQVDCSAGWFGGDNSTKQTMERKNPSLPGNNSENWATSNFPGGTPKSQNSQFTP
jgi:tetrahydromethanopterin S-methyltransferase subunit G